MMEVEDQKDQKTYANLGACNLNQWALDFIGNKRRIVESIRICKERKCTVRLGSELEIPGFGCEDHFLERDTTDHSWQVLAEILCEGWTDDILCVFGMPIIHRSVLYNCSVVALHGKIVFIRPKQAMCAEGNYRENRWFTAFQKDTLEQHELSPLLQKVTNQKAVQFGSALLLTKDSIIGFETCEELWMPMHPSISQGLQGAEIFLNSSGSHHELRKLGTRIDLIKESTRSNGGAYLYSNQRGCDGTRMYFDGSAMVIVNANVVACGSQFSLHDVEVVSATVDLAAIRAFRMYGRSRATQACQLKDKIPEISLDDFCIARESIPIAQHSNIQISQLLPEFQREIGYGPACYLWDYLRRSGATGFFLPLSGGADSGATAVICMLVYKHIHELKDENVLKDLRRVIKDESFIPNSPQQITSKLFFTCFMGSANSSKQTSDRAKCIAQEIGANHFEANIQEIVNSFQKCAQNTFHKEAKFKVQGGTQAEDLALQNIQARSRMVLSYLFSQLIPPQYLSRGGFVLVLSSANLDEGLRGYYTKYDCSSGDINPIGSFSKIDLKSFLIWSADHCQLHSLKDIYQATPTAELTPLDQKTGEFVQTDEDDMGMSYADLSLFGTQRKVNLCGPVSMFKNLIPTWAATFSLKQIADKVKHFFVTYSMNRHKMTTLTPAVHGENYSADDNRFDLRPFLYNTKWELQFQNIDDIVNQQHEVELKKGQPKL